MSSRRSRRAHNNNPKYAAEDFEIDTDFDSHNNNSSTKSTTSSKRSTKRSKTEDIHPEVGKKIGSRGDEEEVENDVVEGEGEGEGEGEAEEEDEINEVEEVTRCICGSDDLYMPKNNHGEFDNVDPGFFIQCETCSVWQHGYCVGIKDEENAPEKYWCEKCKPENHTLFIDKFGIRRSKYDPDHPHSYNHRQIDTLKKGTKRKNGKSNPAKIENLDEQNGKKHTEEENILQIPHQRIATNHNNDNEHSEEYEDEDGHKRKHRKRPSYNYKDYNYEEMLKKALEESARESGVVPEEVNLSSNEGPGAVRETRHNSLRKTSKKSQDEDLPYDTENIKEPKENIHTQSISALSNENELYDGQTKNDEQQNHIKPEKSDPYKKPRADLTRRGRDTRGRSRRATSATSASNDEHEEELDDNKSDQKSFTSLSKSTNSKINSTANTNNASSTPVTPKRKNQREKKDAKQTVIEDKPFRANIPSARINMNEMTRRIFSIMDFVSNIQINLSNEEEFKNNLFKMNNENLTGDIIELKNKLMGCYNDSVDQMDTLTSLLNTWQDQFT
ncbi:hypothetical protein C6P40_002711 [Pichia californica]|uniref:Zinc finger PHD-type domain-containing protein n=1 Tax=Pichia californica TaxID=460514 RepID=A0A9P6WQ85_9ASCO|nr:hypothetical protein C6P42_001648 [[Candida] californica]KAG0691320.1 hypothetical protein C6P40_002711 [[Candida] californica]